jgi:hypothetical protein
VDLANHWGKGKQLRGVRVHAVSNVKTALFEDPMKMHALRTSTSELSGPHLTTASVATPSFETDIKPLFRSRDVRSMQQIKGWRLDVYDDVKKNAAKIQERLKDKSMPCDGAWPDPDIALFESWVTAGMLP